MGSGAIIDGTPAVTTTAGHYPSLMIGQGTLETELIARARLGSSEAFEDLLRPLLEPACRLAYSVLHDWLEAEDAVQEAAIKAWRALPRLREDTPAMRPWFLAIVGNQARSMRRRRGFATITLGRLGAWQPAAAPESDSEELIDLRRAAAGLNDAQRALLFLRYCLDLPLDEAAAVLGLSPVAAKSKLYRALRAMRPALEDSRA